MNLSLNTVKAMGTRNQADFFYVKDEHSRYIEVNDNVLSFLGFSHMDQLYHKTDYDLPWCQYAQQYTKNDQDAMTTGDIQVIEPIVIHNGDLQVSLSYKYQFSYDAKQVAGICGFSKVLNMDTVRKFMPLLESNDFEQLKISSELLNSKVNQHSKIPLTKREMDVLYYMLHGLSQKQIADKLNLSVRTVEDHVDHVKVKLNCGNKYQLFEFAIHHGLMNIIPQHLLSEVI